MVIDLPGGVAELDSDMADITQSYPTESMLGEGEEVTELPLGETEMNAKLGGLISAGYENCISASSQLASTLGLNPHALQVPVLLTPTDATRLRSGFKPLTPPPPPPAAGHEGVVVC